MKRILKKNQIIMTTLAALIAVAGYLNHIEKNEKDLAADNPTGQTEQSDEKTEDVDGEDIVSNDIDMSENPGEAMLVNTVGNAEFVVEARLVREQTRASEKTILMEIVNNTNLTDDERKAAVDKVAEIVDVSEREMVAETLISAKGYEDVVVTIVEDFADVMIVADTLTDAQRAQIEDIVKNKAQIPVENITITTVKTD